METTRYFRSIFCMLTLRQSALWDVIKWVFPITGLSGLDRGQAIVFQVWNDHSILRPTAVNAVHFYSCIVSRVFISVCSEKFI